MNGTHPANGSYTRKELATFRRHRGRRGAAEGRAASARVDLALRRSSGFVTDPESNCRPSSTAVIMLVSWMLLALVVGFLTLTGPLPGILILGSTAAAAGATPLLLDLRKTARARAAFHKAVALWPERACTGEMHQDLAALLGRPFSQGLHPLVLKKDGPDLSTMEAIAQAKVLFESRAIPKVFASEGFNARPGGSSIVADNASPRIVQPLRALTSFTAAQKDSR